MSIDLKDYLRRKRTTIEKFVQISNIKTYQDLLDYCERRGCNSIPESEFNLLINPVKPSTLQKKANKPKIIKKEVEVSDEKKTPKAKTTRKRKSTVSRSTQKVQEERSVDTSVKDS